MKNLILIFFATTIASLSYAQSFENSRKIEKQGKYGVVDNKGNTIIPAQYHTVKRGSKVIIAYKIINTSNQSGCTLFDYSGNAITPPNKYSGIHFISEEVFIVQLGYGSFNSGLITYKNEILLQPKYQISIQGTRAPHVTVLAKGSGVWNIEGLYNTDLKKFTIPLSRNYCSIYIAEKERRVVVKQKNSENSCYKGKYGITDMYGKIIKPCIYDDFTPPFKNEKLEVVKNGEKLYIDKNGNIVEREAKWTSKVSWAGTWSENGKYDEEIVYHKRFDFSIYKNGAYHKEITVDVYHTDNYTNNNWDNYAISVPKYKNFIYYPSSNDISGNGLSQKCYSLDAALKISVNKYIELEYKK